MEQLCAACSGPGCTAVASREAAGCLHTGRRTGSLPSSSAPCRSAASSRLSLSLQRRPAGGWTRGEEEKGVLALPLRGGSLFLEREVGAVLDGMLGSALVAAASCSNASFAALARGLRTSLACLRQPLTVSVMGWACLSLSCLQIPKQLRIPLQ